MIKSGSYKTFSSCQPSICVSSSKVKTNLYLVKHLQSRFKDSFIFQTEKLNKHITQKDTEHSLKKNKLYNCALDKKRKEK